MNDRVPDSAPLLQGLAQLRDRALEADTLNALAFSIANDLYPLLNYRQAVVMAQHGDANFELLCISGLARPEEDSPYLVWQQRAVRWLAQQLPGAQPAWLALQSLQPPPDIAEGWAEWWPAGVWCVPFHARGGERLGLGLYLLDAPPAPHWPALLDGVFKTWAYCWESLTQRTRSRWRIGKRALWGTLAAAIAVLLIPVRQTALAPAEIVSRQAQVISSPINGVIRQIHVRPNQPVQAGELLFSLDDTTLRSRAEVLNKQVVVADAELMAASQRAFDSSQSKSEIALLSARVQQRRAELQEVQAQLERTQVHAPGPGVAVYGDPNDWIGKPVSTGERILHVADPAQPAMRVQLPVADAIALEPGAKVTLFLSAYPLQPLEGQVLETSYQARTGDDGVASYRLLASIDGKPDTARLGLHGTAKLYGERVLLGYYLLRRPLATLRAWSGW